MSHLTFQLTRYPVRFASRSVKCGSLSFPSWTLGIIQASFTWIALVSDLSLSLTRAFGYFLLTLHNKIYFTIEISGHQIRNQLRYLRPLFCTLKIYYCQNILLSFNRITSEIPVYLLVPLIIAVLYKSYVVIVLAKVQIALETTLIHLTDTYNL